MVDWIPSVVAGAILVVIGTIMLRSHVEAWKRQRHDESLTEADRTYLYRRYRRRMQTSSIIVIVGLLIPLGDIFLPRGNPWLITIWWLVVLLLALWLVLMAVGDFATAQAYTRANLARIRKEQRALEEQLAEIQRRRSNGHASHD